MHSSIITPNRYSIYSAYCYGRCTVLCLLVTIVSPAKTAEPIDVPFGKSTQLGSRSQRWRFGSPSVRAVWRWGRSLPVVNYIGTMEREPCEHGDLMKMKLHRDLDSRGPNNRVSRDPNLSKEMGTLWEFPAH